MSSELVTLDRDAILTILGHCLVDFLTENIEHVMFALDINGTLILPGSKISSSVLEVLQGIESRIMLVTAQSSSYVEGIGGSAFPNLVTEKGMTIKISGKVVVEEPPPSVVPSLIKSMERHITSLIHSFVLNPKTVGYAVGFSQEVPATELASVCEFMHKQAADNPAFHVEETNGFIDLTLVALRKVDALAKVEAHFPATCKWIACGDSVGTDGPMLDTADAGIMVTNIHGSYPVLPGPEDMLAVLKWFQKLNTARS